jgi:hypothetical protein
MEIDYTVMVTASFAIGTPLWLPIAFAAYAIGRRRFSLWALLTFVTLESIAIAALAWAIRGDVFFVHAGK